MCKMHDNHMLLAYTRVCMMYTYSHSPPSCPQFEELKQDVMEQYNLTENKAAEAIKNKCENMQRSRNMAQKSE
jgi:hypothetical protein